MLEVDNEHVPWFGLPAGATETMHQVPELS
jgi:hypothetical protein